MATKPHSVVRLGNQESDEDGNPYGDTVAVVNEDGSAYYFSWRSMDWISMGCVPHCEDWESLTSTKTKSSTGKNVAGAK